MESATLGLDCIFLSPFSELTMKMNVFSKVDRSQEVAVALQGGVILLVVDDVLAVREDVMDYANMSSPALRHEVLNVNSLTCEKRAKDESSAVMVPLVALPPPDGLGIGVLAALDGSLVHGGGKH